MPEPTKVLWQTDPSVGDPDDDYTAAVIKDMIDEGEMELVGVVVNRRPAFERAEQFGSTLAALGVQRGGEPVPVGIGAGDIGRPMAPILEGAPDDPAPPPMDSTDVQMRAVEEAEDGSLVVCVTTAATDLDWLMTQPGARQKIGRIVMMGDAVRTEVGPGETAWVPGDAVNNLVDPDAAGRVFERLQTPEWEHVKFTVVSRWAGLAGGQVRPEELDQLAGRNRVAAWLRDRVAVSINERWTAFNEGRIQGRDRSTFVRNHLGGKDPGRRADEPVFDLVDAVPVYDALVPMTLCHPEMFDPAVDGGAPNIAVIGVDREHPGVRNPDALRERLVGRLASGVGASRLGVTGGAGDSGSGEEAIDPQSAAAFAGAVESAGRELWGPVVNSIGYLSARGVRGEPIACLERMVHAIESLVESARAARSDFERHCGIQATLLADPTLGGGGYLGLDR